MRTSLPPQNRLLEYFLYEGGHLVNRVDRSSRAKKGRSFGTVDANGYVTGYVDGRKYYEHRLIWKLHYNTEPDLLDHINGDKQDNRIENLQVLSNRENIAKSHNRSLPTNIYRYGECFRVRLQINGVERHVGIYANLEDAVHARDLALA
jgi:hypothetical protein